MILRADKNYDEPLALLPTGRQDLASHVMILKFEPVVSYTSTT